MSIPPFDLDRTVFPSTVDATAEIGTVIVEPDRARQDGVVLVVSSKAYCERYFFPINMEAVYRNDKNSGVLG